MSNLKCSRRASTFKMHFKSFYMEIVCSICNITISLVEIFNDKASAKETGNYIQIRCIKITTCIMANFALTKNYYEHKVRRYIQLFSMARKLYASFYGACKIVQYGVISMMQKKVYTFLFLI